MFMSPFKKIYLYEQNSHCIPKRINRRYANIQTQNFVFEYSLLQLRGLNAANKTALGWEVARSSCVKGYASNFRVESRLKLANSLPTIFWGSFLLSQSSRMLFFRTTYLGSIRKRKFFSQLKVVATTTKSSFFWQMWVSKYLKSPQIRRGVLRTSRLVHLNAVFFENVWFSIIEEFLKPDSLNFTRTCSWVAEFSFPHLPVLPRIRRSYIRNVYPFFLFPRFISLRPTLTQSVFFHFAAAWIVRPIDETLFGYSNFTFFLPPCEGAVLREPVLGDGKVVARGTPLRRVAGFFFKKEFTVAREQLRSFEKNFVEVTLGENSVGLGAGFTPVIIWNWILAFRYQPKHSLLVRWQKSLEETWENVGGASVVDLLSVEVISQLRRGFSTQFFYSFRRLPISPVFIKCFNSTNLVRPLLLWLYVLRTLTTFICSDVLSRWNVRATRLLPIFKLTHDRFFARTYLIAIEIKKVLFFFEILKIVRILFNYFGNCFYCFFLYRMLAQCGVIFWSAKVGLVRAYCWRFFFIVRDVLVVLALLVAAALFTFTLLLEFAVFRRFVTVSRTSSHISKNFSVLMFSELIVRGGESFFTLLSQLVWEPFVMFSAEFRARLYLIYSAVSLAFHKLFRACSCIILLLRYAFQGAFTNSIPTRTWVGTRIWSKLPVGAFSLKLFRRVAQTLLFLNALRGAWDDEGSGVLAFPSGVASFWEAFHSIYLNFGFLGWWRDSRTFVGVSYLAALYLLKLLALTPLLNFYVTSSVNGGGLLKPWFYSCSPYKFGLGVISLHWQRITIFLKLTQSLYFSLANPNSVNVSHLSDIKREHKLQEVFASTHTRYLAFWKVKRGVLAFQAFARSGWSRFSGFIYSFYKILVGFLVLLFKFFWNGVALFLSNFAVFIAVLGFFVVLQFLLGPAAAYFSVKFGFLLLFTPLVTILICRNVLR